MLLSSARVFNAMAGDAQHIENNVVLAGTVASGIATTTHVLASASTLAQQFSSHVVPGLAIVDGACRFALGLTDMIVALFGDEERLQRHNTSRKKLFLQGIWETAKGAPAFYYGINALNTWSFSLGCYGLAITNTLDFLEDLICCISEIKQKGNHFDREKLIKPLVKGLEAGGWWLLAFGHPAGWICLAVVLAYKLYEGKLVEQLKKEGIAALSFVSSLFGSSSPVSSSISSPRSSSAPYESGTPKFDEQTPLSEEEELEESNRPIKPYMKRAR